MRCLEFLYVFYPLLTGYRNVLLKPDKFLMIEIRMRHQCLQREPILSLMPRKTVDISRLWCLSPSSINHLEAIQENPLITIIKLIQRSSICHVNGSTVIAINFLPTTTEGTNCRDWVLSHSFSCIRRRQDFTNHLGFQVTPIYLIYPHRAFLHPFPVNASFRIVPPKGCPKGKSVGPRST